MTAAESYAALLETAPPELREALTFECNAMGHGSAPGIGHQPVCGACGKQLYGSPGRVPLLIDSAHVALERWVGVREGIIHMYFHGEGAEVAVEFDYTPDKRCLGRGADIFEAVSAALGA